MNDDQERPDYLHAERGLRSWLLTTDHKRIGVLFLVAVARRSCSLGGIFALLLRTRAAHPERDLIDAITYNRCSRCTA